MSDRVSGAVFVSDFAACHAAVRDIIMQPGPAFLARIGGSDADLVIDYYDRALRLGADEAARSLLPHFDIVRRYNGYYDKDQDPARIGTFFRLMTRCYLASPDQFVVGARFLTEFFPDVLNPVYHVDNSAVSASLRLFFNGIAAQQREARFYPYNFIEKLLEGQHTFFRVLAETLPGRRVLAVTPFAQSIEANFHRRHEFFRNFAYPEYRLSTYNTPITYAGLPDEFYPDRDWFATVERMKAEIGALDFDIALLSCGSYAMPLGMHIRDVLGRKAIYVGGVLQLFFGITGRRYDNPFFTDQINANAFILPLERERYLQHVAIGPETAREAFGAYF